MNLLGRLRRKVTGDANEKQKLSMDDDWHSKRDACVFSRAVSMGRLSDITLQPVSVDVPQPEFSQITSLADPNQAMTPAEPNQVASQAAAVKDTFKDEPEAHALFEKMIETMRKADSLSYKGDCGNCTYMIWMKKPNYFRVETVNSKGAECGTLVGDGDHLWMYWPWDNSPVSNEADGLNYNGAEIYMKRATPLGRHSIGHEVGWLRAGMGMTVIDPSTFHGYTDSLQPYLDGVRSWYTEAVEGHECDVIEVSFMKRQRIWYLWLSRQDHLPRKLKEVVRVARPLVMYEYWSDVQINAEIPNEKFVWAPPAGWQQWTPPDPEEKLLKPGTEAPDFELLLADDTKVKLSDYRGKIVWFYMWRVG
jgi:outer membrane lipoprotein-sorting protein